MGRRKCSMESQEFGGIRVLITGGFGYLGGRIAVELSRDPGFIIILGSRKTQLAPKWLPQAEIVALDVLEPKTLVNAVEGVHAVVHLAAMNASECAVDPDKAVLVNTLGTLNVLQTSIDAGVERFIYFSTAHVYGAPLIECITEATLPRPIHPYAITHCAAEKFVLAAHNQNKIVGIALRLSNGFGAPTHPDVDCWTLLVNDLCRQAVQTRKMVLRSNGLQQRDFISLMDVGRAVKHLISLPRGDCADGLFNLGGKASLSVWEMAQRVAQRCQIKLGFLPEIVRPEPRVNEQVEALQYNCDKLLESGYTLNGVIEEAIDETLLFCAKARDRIV